MLLIEVMSGLPLAAHCTVLTVKLVPLPAGSPTCFWARTLMGSLGHVSIGMSGVLRICAARHFAPAKGTFGADVVAVSRGAAAGAGAAASVG